MAVSCALALACSTSDAAQSRSLIKRPQHPAKQFLTPGLTTTYSPGQLFASEGNLEATLRAWRSAGAPVTSLDRYTGDSGV